MHGLDPCMFPKVNEPEEEYDVIDSGRRKSEVENEGNEDNGLVSESDDMKNKTTPPSSPTDSGSKKKGNSSPIIIVKQSNITGWFFNC